MALDPRELESFHPSPSARQAAASSDLARRLGALERSRSAGGTFGIGPVTIGATHVLEPGAVGHVMATLRRTGAGSGGSHNVLEVRADQATPGGWAELDLYSSRGTADGRRWNVASRGDTGALVFRALTDARGGIVDAMTVGRDAGVFAGGYFGVNGSGAGYYLGTRGGDNSAWQLYSGDNDHVNLWRAGYGDILRVRRGPGTGHISLPSNGVGPPNNAGTSGGWRLRTYADTTEYGIGIDTSVQWYTSQNQHRFYSRLGGSGEPFHVASINSDGIELPGQANGTDARRARVSSVLRGSVAGSVNSITLVYDGVTYRVPFYN